MSSPPNNTGASSSTFRRMDAGSRTVEGNVSGSRAAALEQQRLQAVQDFEAKKHALSNKQIHVHARFRTATKASAAEQAFSTQTVGLVTAHDFSKAAEQKQKHGNTSVLMGAEDKNDAMGEANNNSATETEEERQKREKAERKARKKKLKEKKKQMSTLSFAADEDEDADETTSPTKKRMKKDATVDTSFLPDAQRDEDLAQERLRLQDEWKQAQLAMKKERLEITYSYWDGSGHRRSLQCQKGDSIGQFLALAVKQLGKEFRNLQGLASDELLYVKEDLILPHDVTFYDLIATKARGKSGPLFYFDVHDDVRVGAIDSRVEKEESHPGKIVERKWYERNKHIFPASRWQVYDPTVTSYGQYKIGGK